MLGRSGHLQLFKLYLPYYFLSNMSSYRSYLLRFMACFLLLILSSLMPVIAYGQSDYPIPPASAGRLFYIQNSDSHNTFLYDAVMEDGKFAGASPVKVYRIIYDEDGRTAPLTAVQRTFAYGLSIKQISPGFFEMHLAASKKLKFYLTINDSGQPYVYLTANNRKMYLDRIFLHIKKGSSGLNIKLDKVTMFGKDYLTGKPVEEFLSPEDL